MTSPTQSQIRDALNWWHNSPREPWNSEYARIIDTILQSALDTQKPAGDALTGDCGGGDLEPINCLEEAIALSASACYMEGVRAYYDTTWIEALVEASRRYLALTADNAERGE